MPEPGVGFFGGFDPLKLEKFLNDPNLWMQQAAKMAEFTAPPALPAALVGQDFETADTGLITGGGEEGEATEPAPPPTGAEGSPEDAQRRAATVPPAMRNQVQRLPFAPPATAGSRIQAITQGSQLPIGGGRGPDPAQTLAAMLLGRR
jgi:hypothetical protein